MSFAGTIAWRRRTPRRHMAASGEKWEKSRCLLYYTGSVIASEWQCQCHRRLLFTSEFNHNMISDTWCDFFFYRFLHLRHSTFHTVSSKQLRGKLQQAIKNRKDASDQCRLFYFANILVSHCVTCIISCRARNATLARAPSPLGMARDRRWCGGRNCLQHVDERRKKGRVHRKTQQQLRLGLIIEILFLIIMMQKTFLSVSRCFVRGNPSSVKRNEERKYVLYVDA